MSRLFVIADTHGHTPMPPVDCDISIHLGDAVDAFKGDADAQAREVALMRRYTYAVIGNHEDMLFTRGMVYGVKGGISAMTAADLVWLREQRLQPAQSIQIGRYSVWLGHYLNSRPGIVGGSGMPADFENDAMRGLANQGHQLILFGHTHQRMERDLGGCKVVNPGYGEKGQYAVIDLDDSEISVAFFGEVVRDEY